MPRDKNTEVRILEAARKIFHTKGLGGARMAAIAEEAEINKAMLHYYFKSKEQLFEKVFEEAFSQVVPGIFHILNTDKPIRIKVEEIASFYIRTLSDNPQLPVFVLNAIQYDPDKFLKNFLDRYAEKLNIQTESFLGKLMIQFQQGVAAGELPPVDPRQFMLSLVGMSVFPFMMKPMVKLMMGMSEEGFQQLMKERETLIPQLLLGNKK
jgi:AcrR family transcriptional regulator